jgi:dTDP-4-amino-4,6-dideoxygalactose transaminase
VDFGGLELNNRPAILGGKPVSDKTIPLAQPTLFPPEEISKPLSDIFSTGQITNAKYVKILEEEAAHYLGTKHAVAVSSCTSGLILLEQALGLAGEVIVPSFTFCATAHSLLWNSLKPVFVDCERETHNIDPRKVQEAVTPRTSAILAVDIFGNPCNRETLQKIAKTRNLRLIIDAAHSFGALYMGEKIGGYGDAQVVSLSPTKMVVAGEGGIVLTNSDTLAKRLRLGRNYGNPEDYNCEFPGLNARMAEVNAIIALKSFAMVEENVTRRNRLVAQYKSGLSTIPGISFQRIRTEDRSAYKDFSLLIEPGPFGLNRDEVGRALAAENIQTRAYFYPPVHRQKAYRNFAQGYEGKLPNTEEVSSKALSLPLYSHMPKEHVDRICGAVEAIHKYADDIRTALSKDRA